MDWQAEKTLYLQCFAGENQNGGRVDVVGFSCFLRGQSIDRKRCVMACVFDGWQSVLGAGLYVGCVYEWVRLRMEDER